MLNAREKKSVLPLTAMLILVIGCLAVPRAQAQQAGTGIWTYSDASRFSITLVNLTTGPLTIDSSNLITTGGCVLWDQPFTKGDYTTTSPSISVDPFHSVTWKAYGGCWTSPYYSGTLTFLANFSGSSPGTYWKFNLNFTPQAAAGIIPGTGTWIGVAPYNPNIWAPDLTQRYVSPAAYWPHKYEIYTTTFNDKRMHNIMVIQSADYAQASVALYSQDNDNLVLVVQQTAAIQQKANANYGGDDSSYNWWSWKLDWVDNHGSSVPGQ